MDSKPLLTVIVLTFNNEKSIGRCIDSLLAQKTTYPYQIRIYDDCSLDRNIEICEQYVKNYPEKIKLTVQPENTFLKPYNKTQAFQAFQEIDTKYFCIIEGDDYWCNENKIQMALDFLESHPDYAGWGHDTLQIDENSGIEQSYVHDIAKYKIENPIRFDNRFIFLLTSSRIFRMFDFKKLKIWPVDYLVYNYHLSKGPLYYHDEIMAVYTVGPSGTFTTLSNRCIADMNGMFSYKVSKILDFEFDDLCTEMQKHYDSQWQRGEKSYNRLKTLKKIFGVKFGWRLWFFLRFVWKYGFESMDVNYVYPRKKIKKNSNDKFKKSIKEAVCEESKQKLAKAYNEYLLDKNNLEKRNNFCGLLVMMIVDFYSLGLWKNIGELFCSYPDFGSYIADTLTSKITKLQKQNKKYKLQRNFLMGAIVLLIIFLLLYLFIYN